MRLLPLSLLGLVVACTQPPPAPPPWRSAPVPTRPTVAVPDDDEAENGCPEDFARTFESGPQEPGPFRLERGYCVHLRSRDSGLLLLSPDGNVAAHWGDGRVPAIEAVPLDGSRGLLFRHRESPSLRMFVTGEPRGTGGIAWTRDMRGLWTTRQPAVRPSGFALGPIEPFLIGRDGHVGTLPPLRHPAGPLDAIHWVGGDGLALAQFGTRGNYYRPQHEDPLPTLAMVDARRGRILAAFSAQDVPGIRERVRAWGVGPNAVAAVILPDGRLKAVLQFPPWQTPRTAGAGTSEQRLQPGRWLIWTQGEPPRVVPLPAGVERVRLALSPDGRQLLATQAVQATGVIVEHAPSPPPTPVTGRAAELFDLASLRSLWWIEARAERMWNGPATPSAITPDGRHALIVLPPGPDDYTVYALVELRTGRIVQRLKPFHIWTYAQSFGFTADGRRLWFASGNIVVRYRWTRG